MVSYPYLVTHGFKIYSDFIHPYPPVLTFLLAAVFKSFGFSLINLKLVSWILICLNDLLIYLIVSKLTKNKIQAMLAVLLYILTQPFLEGNMLWFDMAIVTPVLAGILFLLKKENLRNLALSGLFFALAVFIKQTAALLVVVAFIYLLVKSKKLKSIFVFLTPGLILGLVFLSYLLSTQQFQDFFNWNLVYPFTYWNKFPDYVQMGITKFQFLVVALLTTPLVLLIFKNLKTLTREGVFMLMLLLMALVMIYPRFSFFHFQLALALITITFAYLTTSIRYKYYLYTIYIVIILVSIVRLGIDRTWGLQARFWTTTDLKLAYDIKQISNNKSIYLLGPSSSLYVYSDLLPPKPWTDNFGWYLELPNVQEEIIAGWENDPAEYVFWQQPQLGNWYDLATYQPRQITDWIKTNYTNIGNLDENIQIWKIKN